MSETKGIILAGIGAGAINGLFGAGGGMVLVPLLCLFTDLEDEVFPVSVSMILPICLISLGFTLRADTVNWQQTLPYLLGSILGGLGAGFFGKKIPVLWLHRFLGAVVLLGGIRYLC